MRILSFSDMHDNVEAVRRLRFLETNRFDAVIIAGDMGWQQAAEILRIAETFSCPVLYVLGNHDPSEPFDSSIRPPAIHIHNGPTIIGDRCIVGYSGVDVGWGANPIADQVWEEYEPEMAKYKDLVDKDTRLARTGQIISSGQERLRQTKPWKEYQALVTARRRAIFDRNIERVAALHKETGIDEKNTIFVSHGRTYKMKNFFPDLGLHLFGHAHGFQNIKTGNTRFINVSALDLARAVLRKKEGDAEIKVPGFPYYNFGTYTVIEIQDEEISVQSIRLWPGGEEYKTLRGRMSGHPSVHSQEELWAG